ncbi:MAG: hypothetical protein AAGM84_13580 [Pseudomonadota bacterium]
MRMIATLISRLVTGDAARPPEAEAEDGVIVPLHHLHRRNRSRVPAPLQVPKQTKTAAKPALSIPCPDPTGEERSRDTHQTRGQRMARQEDWAKLSATLADADMTCAMTEGGMPVAELLAFGARADVVQAAEHALLGGWPEPDAPLLDGIAQLEEVLAAHDGDAMIAAVVALAHVDIGLAWRGNTRLAEVPRRNRDACDAHFDRARDILAAVCQAHTASPLLASALCAAGATDAQDPATTIHAYERLLSLDPSNARAFRAMGLRLLPRRGGSLDALELHARRMAARTHATWGAGGYTWAMLDAIACDDGACAQLDVEFFIDGLHDIIARRPDQHVINTLAAYCANTMGTQIDGSDEAALVRAQIADCADWIVREHMTELHPMIWAHAARGFDQGLRIRCLDRFAAAGLADAHRILGDVFRREIAAGHRIVFTEAGAETLSA